MYLKALKVYVVAPCPALLQTSYVTISFVFDSVLDDIWTNMIYKTTYLPSDQIIHIPENE